MTNGQQIRFADTSAGEVTTWHWEFGDGNVSLEQHPSHLYSESGNYSVLLTVEGPGGASTTVRNLPVRVDGPPAATPTVNMTVARPAPTATAGQGEGASPWVLIAVAAIGLLAGGAALVQVWPSASPAVETVPGVAIRPRGRLRRSGAGSETGIEIEVRGGMRRER